MYSTWRVQCWLLSRFALTEISCALVSFLPKTEILSWVFEQETNAVLKDMNIQVSHQQDALSDLAWHQKAIFSIHIFLS